MAAVPEVATEAKSDVRATFGEPPTQSNVSTQNGTSDDANNIRPNSASVSVLPAHSIPSSRKLPPVPKFSDESFSNPSMSSLAASDGKGRAIPPVPKFWESSEEQSKDTGAPQAVPALATPSQMIQPASLALADEKLSASKSHSEDLSAEEPRKKAGDESELLNPKPSGSRSTEEDQSSQVSLEEIIESDLEKQASIVASSGRGDARTPAAVGVSSSQPPYVRPPWSAAPGEPYNLEILKEGSVLGVEDVSKKGAYMFGRSDRCDFVLEHPTVSRYHAVLQFNAVGDSFIYDLGSTHGTFVNKSQVKGKEYVALRVGDIIRFGLSSRLHIFQGPLERMPKEGLSKKERKTVRLVEGAQDRSIREASIARGKMDARMSDGISWGMDEDAEEEEDDEDEVTWQTYKGQLTERQEKTLDKVHRHNEKLSNLKKENDAIQAKEMSQGGLTQGQQTQVARNELRMGQLLEELESMEETLNESIRESISGRTGKPRQRSKMSFNEDEEDDLSDDEFYDRAGKMQRKKKEVAQRVETTDSLLDKKAVLTAEVESLSRAIHLQEEKAAEISQETPPAQTAGGTADSLDQFMTTVTSKIETENVTQLKRELEPFTKELELVERLLKISDPTGDGLRKWTLKQRLQVGKGLATATAPMDKGPLSQENATQRLSSSSLEANVEQARDASDGPARADGIEVTTDAETATSDVALDAGRTVLPALDPPLRLGAPMPETFEEERVEISEEVHEEAARLVDYKDRKKEAKVGSETSTERTEQELAVDEHIADSVALLLRHKRGLAETDHDDPQHNQNKLSSDKPKVVSKKSSKKRKKEAATMPSGETDMDDVDSTWMPPAGQTGDGRTALNDKYGY